MKIEFDSNILRNLFRNVYFFNGTAYAGKSTMVQLLSEKYDGICCGENYHMELMNAVDQDHQPNLCYLDTMVDWQEFIGRTPEEYDAWITGCSYEAAQLEIIMLLRLCQLGKKIFVDTNIPLRLLHEISDEKHVVIMLSPQELSVNRFFDRPDADKQFIYQQILKAKDPEAAMKNYRRCLERINSQEHYNAFANSGFFTYVRNEDSTIEDALSKVEKHLQLI